MSPCTHGPGVSNRWSCTTLGEGLDHVKANMDDSEEAALLRELEELQCQSVNNTWFYWHGEHTWYKIPNPYCLKHELIFGSSNLIIRSSVQITWRVEWQALRSLCMTLDPGGAEPATWSREPVRCCGHQPRHPDSNHFEIIGGSHQDHIYMYIYI